MVLADFDSYANAQKKAVELYQDQRLWNKMGLVNIANAGRFAADRAIRDYAQNIWNATPVPEMPKTAQESAKEPVKKLFAKKKR